MGKSLGVSRHDGAEKKPVELDATQIAERKRLNQALLPVPFLHTPV
jgi:hypothetical protein